MMRTRSALETLIAGLRGDPIGKADWRSVIALANRTLLTPALFTSLEKSGQIERLPRDVRDYLQFIHDCNRERNVRLRAQLLEAVATLNREGLIPILLKGAVPLFLAPPDQVPARMTSDLDLAIEASEEASARHCLEELGYVQASGARGMTRPQDAGLLELRPSRSNGFEPPQFAERDGLQVRIPPVPSRALHWIMHDLFKEGDYWRGRLDLRHIHDLAQLAESDSVDWSALRAAMPDKSARNAFDTHLVALHQFFGINVPAECTHRPMARLQHWRRVFSATHPVIGAPFRLTGNLVWGGWRVWHADDLVRRGSVDFVYRAARTVVQGGSKI